MPELAPRKLNYIADIYFRTVYLKYFRILEQFILNLTKDYYTVYALTSKIKLSPANTH